MRKYTHCFRGVKHFFEKKDKGAWDPGATNGGIAFHTNCGLVASCATNPQFGISARSGCDQTLSAPTSRPPCPVPRQKRPNVPFCSGSKQVQPFGSDGGGQDAPRYLRPPRCPSPSRRLRSRSRFAGVRGERAGMPGAARGARRRSAWSRRLGGVQSAFASVTVAPRSPRLRAPLASRHSGPLRPIFILPRPRARAASAALSCAPRAVASLGALHSAVRLPAGGSGGPLQHPLCSCRATARSERPGRRSPTGLRAEASRARIAPDGALRRRLRLRCGARHMALARRARIARRPRPRPEAPRRPPAPSSPNPRLRAGPGTPQKSHRIPCEISIYYQINISREFGAFSGGPGQGPGGGLALIGRGLGIGAEGVRRGKRSLGGARRGRADGHRHADASRQRRSNATTRREAPIRICEADKARRDARPGASGSGPSTGGGGSGSTCTGAHMPR